MLATHKVLVYSLRACTYFSKSQKYLHLQLGGWTRAQVAATITQFIHGASSVTFRSRREEQPQADAYILTAPARNGINTGWSTIFIHKAVAILTQFH